MMKGVERRGVSRREGQCVLDVRCVCASHESGLQVNPGGRCSRQSWGLYHQTRYWLETTVWYQAPDHGCQWSSSCSFLFLLLFPSPTIFFSFIYLYFLIQIDWEQTLTEQRDPGVMPVSFSLSLTLTYTPFIALLVIFEDATLTGIGWRLNELHSKLIWSETTQRKPKQNRNRNAQNSKRIRVLC